MRSLWLLLLSVLMSLATADCLSGSCTMDKVIQDVAVTVVSEVTSLLMTNDCLLRGMSKCRPRDCADVQRQGHKKSGVYQIWPRGGDTCGTDVYCDLELDGGGWTIIQQRGNFGRPVDFFYKIWRDYKFGFGNISEDFWLGNDKIHLLTNQENCILRVDLKADDGEFRHAQYEEFYIEPETSGYKLGISGYSGDAGDSLSGHGGHMFSTRDKDNDKFEKSCAEQYKGGWWYTSCHSSNLNGLYLNGKHDSYADGVIWYHWKGHHFSYQNVTMKIRPKYFHEISLSISV